MVCPEMVPRLPALYRPMKGLETRPSSIPDASGHVGADMEDAEWEDFWQTLDFTRLQLERPLGISFRAAFDKLLPFRERLAMPVASLRLLGGDATLERFGSIGWKSGKFAVEDFSQYAEFLRAEIRHGDIAEMMAFVALACSEATNWKGELVLYVTDNDNVRSWLTKRRPRNLFARLLVCLVQRLEAKYDFSLPLSLHPDVPQRDG